MAASHAAKGRLHIVPREPAVTPTFIGPDYARILKRDWGRLHAIADRRAPLEFAPSAGRWLGTDRQRFER